VQKFEPCIAKHPKEGIVRRHRQHLVPLCVRLIDLHLERIPEIAFVAAAPPKVLVKHVLRSPELGLAVLALLHHK
jgi:hypothetical protein